MESVNVDKAAASIRESLKWILVSFAVMFSFLAGGLNFLSLGLTLPLLPLDYLRIFFVVLAVGVAVVAVIKTGQALVLDELSINDLAIREQEAITRWQNDHPETVVRNHLIEIFEKDKVLRVLRPLSLLTFSGTCSPMDVVDALQNAKKQHLDDSKSLSRAKSDVSLLVGAANLAHLKMEFSSTLRWAGAAFGVVTLSLAGIAFSPEEFKSITVTDPIPAKIFFDDSADLTELGFGADCVPTTLDGVIIGGRLESPVTRTSPTQDCESVVLSGESHLFVVIPDV